MMHKTPTESLIVRLTNRFFHHAGHFISAHPWKFIVVSTILTIITSIKIPMTEMVNNISDFTPYGARSRQELVIYEQFFANRGQPKTIYAFCSAKEGSNMLGLQQLNHTVQVLDKISSDFYLQVSNKSMNFEQFCSGFCLVNEPVRHFYSGLQVVDEHPNDTSTQSHLDLGYPVTTVLGTKLYMDPNFFGVKIVVKDETGLRRVVSVSDNSLIVNDQTQLSNNIRQIDLVVLQFRAEIGSNVDPEDLKAYEQEIVNYFSNYSSPYIDVHVLTDQFITSEIVRAGLTLLPFLVIGFTIMAIFSSITFTLSAIWLDQMSLYKIVLAIMACVAPFMACGVTLGGMFWCGLRFGSILCVTPFLVLAIGVDDAYLMVNAWQRISTQRRRMPSTDVNAEVRHRLIETLVETGPSVAITTITNVLAFGIGAMTPTPEIQLFSIGNALAVVVDFIFQLTIYAALIAVVGKYEVNKEINNRDINKSASRETLEEMSVKRKLSEASDDNSNSLLNIYCHFISNKYVSSAILGLLAVYWYISIMGVLNIKAELSPDKLFLKDSSIVKIFDHRKNHITPFYDACWILVGSPGDINSEQDKQRLHNLIDDFESIRGSVGKYSTKFWLRDYEDFLRQSESLDIPLEYDVEPDTAIEFTQNGSLTVSTALKSNGNELKQFLEWPEFSFWRGFIQYNSSSDNTSYVVTKFLVTTAYHGHQLVDWSNRALLLNQWRSVADKYPDLNVSVFEDDAKFLDLIETMIPIASQSAFYTFVSMFIVAFLYISHPPTLFVATFSILSTSLGVFGIMSWWGADLDPILMSATVMSIGFSVDIPSHISYHYFKTGGEMSCSKRIKDTVAAVGFPIMQASISTILCVLSLFFVDLHMSQIFAKCMLLVVVIGMVHGLVVIPVVFNIISTIPRKVFQVSSSTVVLPVNQH